MSFQRLCVAAIFLVGCDPKLDIGDDGDAEKPADVDAGGSFLSDGSGGAAAMIPTGGSGGEAPSMTGGGGEPSVVETCPNDSPGEVEGATLVAHYAFDECEGAVVLDKSAAGRRGFIERQQKPIDSALPPRIAGRFGKTIEWDGMSTVKVAATSSINQALLQRGGFTFGLWLRPSTDLPGNDPNFLSQKGVVDSRPVFEFGLRGGFLAGSIASFLILAPTPLRRGEWQHVAFSYDGTDARLFVDGVEAAFRPIGWPLDRIDTPLIIGGSAMDVLKTLHSHLIDDIQIYAGAMTPLQVRRLASLGVH